MCPLELNEWHSEGGGHEGAWWIRKGVNDYKFDPEKLRARFSERNRSIDSR